jgi:predicted glycosyltransferase
MAREAACMGKPAVSFFPNTLLSVDQQMIDNGQIFHSRSPIEILEYLESLSKSNIKPDRSRSADVLDEVVNIINEIADRI